MKAFRTLVIISACGLLAIPANAKTIFDQLNDTAPRSVFDDLRDTAPRTVFDDLRDTAPRSVFDDLRDSSPVRKPDLTDGVFVGE